MKAHELIAKVRDLPTISPATLALVSVLGQSEKGNEDVVRIVEQDIVLTAKLLRACNSAAMALEEPVGSVDQAVLLLGREQISRMVLAISTRPLLQAPLRAYAIESGALWQHSLLAAVAAEVTTSQGILLDVGGAAAFTVGLLHDIGKLVINEFLNEQLLSRLSKQISEGRSAAEAERELLNTDHAEVGSALAYIWRLPNILVEAIGLHHTPPLRPAPRLSALAFFADRMAHLSESLTESYNIQLSTRELEIGRAIGFNEEGLPSLFEKLRICSAQTDNLVVAA